MEEYFINATLDGDIFTIPKEDWALGIFVGTEGMVFNYEGARYKVIRVNLKTRKIITHYLGIASGAV